jgi:putative transposase
LTGANPTDRGKLGTKRHVLTDKNGIPLSVVITAANIHDMKAAIKTLDKVVLRKRPKDMQNLCLDKGYDFSQIEHESLDRGYIPHIRHRGEGRRIIKNLHKVRRWVVERTNSWHNRFRKLLVRYEKKVENYLGLVQLACCIIVYRRTLLG